MQQTVVAAEIESRATIVYSNKPQNSIIKINSSNVNKNGLYKSSNPIKFDILLDEKIEDSDPRIKSIIYVTKQNKYNYIQITYTNLNANGLATNIAILLHNLGIKIEKPFLVNSTIPDDLKYVFVQIKYYQFANKNNESEPKISKDK